MLELRKDGSCGFFFAVMVFEVIFYILSTHLFKKENARASTILRVVNGYKSCSYLLLIEDILCKTHLIFHT